MALDKILSVSGKGVPVMGDDIDTDQIIPARFMKCVTFDGLADFAFFDAIKEAEADGRVYPFRSERFKDASILVTGANFGCGSSREHAPQSLYRAGVRAIVAESFAEIFFGNAITLGMPCVTMPRIELNKLAALVSDHPEHEIHLDLNDERISAGEWSGRFEIQEAARQALVEGKWDPITELLESERVVEEVAASLSYITGY